MNFQALKWMPVNGYNSSAVSSNTREVSEITAGLNLSPSVFAYQQYNLPRHFMGKRLPEAVYTGYA